MRRSSTTRLVTAATGSIVLWLLGASIADAAPARRHHVHVRSPRVICATGVESRPFAGALLFRRTLQVHRHIVPKLQRNRAKAFTDYDEGIQNAAAVGGEGELRLITVLEPLGMLAVSHQQLTSHRTVSRRTPRGPPSPA
jgi:hypothetical protein